jgi:hypothetical protein
LFKSIKDDVAAHCAESVEILGAIADDKSLSLLHSFLDTPYKSIHKGVFRALMQLADSGSPKVFPLLHAFRKKGKCKVENYLMFDLINHLHSNYIKQEEFRANCIALVPIFRKLLEDKNGGIKEYAASILITLNDNIFPYLNNINPASIDVSFLASIGSDIARVKSNKLFIAAIHYLYDANDDIGFRRYSRILIAIVKKWKDKLRQLDDIDELYLNKIKSSQSNASAKMFSVQFLIKLVELYNDSKHADRIARLLLSVKGLQKPFILRNLATIRRLLSPELRQSVERDIRALLISKSPPYGEWFNQAKNPGKVITANVYFQREQDVWDVLLKKNGFKTVSSQGKETCMEKKINGVTLNVLMIDVSDQRGKLRINIFKDMADPKIHYVGYNGHAGMGGNLEMNRPQKDDDPTAYGTKIMQIGACSSMSSYYARVLKIAPNVQFIGNEGGNYSEDDAKVFIATMNGIAFQKSWDKIERDIRKTAPFVYHYQDKLPRTYFNHVLPNDMDQFKYAILNEFTVAGVVALTFAAPRQEILDINAQYGGKLRQAIHNVNVFISNHPFFENAEFITGNQVYDGIYFLSSTDDQTPLITEKAMHPRRKTYKTKLNAGYSHNKNTNL